MSSGVGPSRPRGCGKGHFLGPLPETAVPQRLKVKPGGPLLTGFSESRPCEFQELQELPLLPATQVTAGGPWGGAEKFLYSAAQAKENGVSTA